MIGRESPELAAASFLFGGGVHKPVSALLSMKVVERDPTLLQTSYSSCRILLIFFICAILRKYRQTHVPCMTRTLHLIVTGANEGCHGVATVGKGWQINSLT